MSSLLFHLYILLATLVLYNLYTHIAIFLLPVSSDFPTQTLGATPYQFLKFTQQWPKAVNESSQLTNFTIHGCGHQMLPYECCVAKEKNLIKARCVSIFLTWMPHHLEKKLNTSWPNVKNGTDMDLWRHEYNHHGTCCEDTFKYNQTKYFDLADEMWGKLTIAQMLANSSIVPETQHEPNIRCTNKTLREGVCKKIIIITLLEVVVCYDHDGKKKEWVCEYHIQKKMIRCPKDSTCGSQNQSILYVK
ncbi:unnamed protein product [Malus baccata var. baccata]